MKTKLISILIVFMLVLVSCDETTKFSVHGEKYKVVIPTSSELNEIIFRLDDILSTQFDSYSCETNNAYEKLFSYNKLGFTVPNYPEKLQTMTEFSENGTVVYENDPLGYFGEVTKVTEDEDGSINTDTLELGTLIGYRKYYGKYIDFLVEGIWNGKINHDSLMSFDDGTKCYYYDGYYYLPEEITAIGGGIFHVSEIKDVTPIGDNKYEVKYAVYNYYEDYYDYSDDELYLNATSVISMKESKDGFRFWSIYSIDIENVDSLRINTGVR